MSGFQDASHRRRAADVRTRALQDLAGRAATSATRRAAGEGRSATGGRIGPGGAGSMSVSRCGPASTAQARAWCPHTRGATGYPRAALVNANSLRVHFLATQLRRPIQKKIRLLPSLGVKPFLILSRRRLPESRISRANVLGTLTSYLLITVSHGLLADWTRPRPLTLYAVTVRINACTKRHFRKRLHYDLMTTYGHFPVARPRKSFNIDVLRINISHSLNNSTVTYTKPQSQPHYPE
jgi:hypothetical protein